MDIQPFSPEAEKTQNKPDIKLIAVDLDGTLLNEKHTVSERNRDTLKKAIDAGITVILATGKTRYSAESIIADLALKTPGIYVQGLVVFNGDGSVRHQQTLDAHIARRVMTVAEDRGFTVMAYSGNRILVQKSNERTEDFKKYGEPDAEEVGPLYNILTTIPINKLLLVGDPSRVKALRWQLDKHLSGEARLMAAGIANMVEVMPAGYSKGRALKQLLKELSVAPENVMAIGDGENDLEMLELAGLAVAVGNADERLKAIADEVVSDNTKDGVAEAIERFVLPPEPEKAADTKAEKADKTPKSESGEEKSDALDSGKAEDRA